MSLLKIKVLLPAIIGAMALVAIAQGVIGLSSMTKLHDDAVFVGEQTLPSVNLINQINTAASDIRLAHASLALAGMRVEIDDSLASLERRTNELQELRARYEAYLRPGPLQTSYDAFSAAWQAYLTSAEPMVARAAEGHRETAQAIYTGPMRDTYRAIEDTVVELRRISAEATAETLAAGEATYTASRNITMAAMVIALVIAIGAVAFAILRVSRPISRITAAMSEVAAGDLEKRIPFDKRRDEIGEMASAVVVFRDAGLEKLRLEGEAEEGRALTERERREREEAKAREAAEIETAVTALGDGLRHLSDGDVAYRIDAPFAGSLDRLRQDFNESLERLEETLASVGENSRAIHAGSEEIRVAADDLSKRTEQQAASVEETAAALEEITTTVKDASKRADEAGTLVANAKAQAERSGEVVNRAITAMGEIEGSSEKIGSIIGVIDDIAFQTNLLALNAGVEAARAGEAGKGFAVVAQEVRELAQRSAGAAKEIKGLITSSGEQVKSGAELVGETGKALEAIVAQVNEIHEHVSAIVESAREQSIGLGEINTAVNDIDQGTQQNAAMVEQSTAASHGLAREAQSLQELLSKFKLSSDVMAAPRAQASTARTPDAAPAKPAESPARALGRKLAGAFAAATNGNAALKTEEDWQEF